MKIDSDNPFLSMNQSAAVVLAAAVVELFPGALLSSGQGSAQYFFYDIVFPFPFQPELLTLIEERMRLILKEKRAVKLLEMMPLNAAELMRHRGQVLAAELLSNLERATTFLCQIGNCVVYTPEGGPETLEIPFFKLFEGVVFAIQGQSFVRVVGAAGEKSAVKSLFKQPLYSSREHRRLAEKDALMAPMAGEEAWIWRPRGEKLRGALLQWWQRQMQVQQFSCISLPIPTDADRQERALIQAHRDYFLRFQENRVAQIAFLSQGNAPQGREGFLAPECTFVDRGYLFCSDEYFLEECISSLQFILQIPKILGFEYELVLTVSLEAPKTLRQQAISLWEKACEKLGVVYRLEKRAGTPFVSCIEVCLPDALGRKWATSFVGIPLDPMPVGKGRMLVRSSLGSWERMLALLLENAVGGWNLDALYMKLNEE